MHIFLLALSLLAFNPSGFPVVTYEVSAFDANGAPTAPTSTHGMVTLDTLDVHAPYGRYLMQEPVYPTDTAASLDARASADVLSSYPPPFTLPAIPLTTPAPVVTILH